MALSGQPQVTARPLGNGAGRATIADVTGDGRPDVLVPMAGDPATRLAGRVTLFVNLGDGALDIAAIDATEPKLRLLRRRR